LAFFSSSFILFLCVSSNKAWLINAQRDIEKLRQGVADQLASKNEEIQRKNQELEKSMPIKLNMCERTICQLPVVTSKEVLQTKEYLKIRVKKQNYRTPNNITKFYLFCSSIVIHTVIVTAGTFEP
jgi:ribosomal protein L9